MSATTAQIEDAVRAWLTTASGLAAGRVYLLHQNIHLDETVSRIAFGLGGFNDVGGPPALAQSYNGAAPLGQEVTYTAQTVGELTVEVQAFAQAPQDGVSSTSPAFDLLRTCRAALGLPTIRDALNAVGLGVLEAIGPRHIPQLEGAGYEDRAFLDVRFFMVETAQEKIGYIATVQITPTVSGVTLPPFIAPKP